MIRPSLPILSIFAFGLSGCVMDEQQTLLVTDNPFGHQVSAPAKLRTSFAQASVEVAAQVDGVGRKLMKANKQLNLNPQQDGNSSLMFRTIGAPQPEIFHVGTSEIVITEGLAKQCATEGQLAAVLSHEIGKMIADREALAGPKTKIPERRPPLEPPIGKDFGSSFGGSDQLQRAELGQYEREYRHRLSEASALPDPQALARGYLAKAEYQPADLDAALPLIRAAEENRTFARQLTAPVPVVPQ